MRATILCLVFCSSSSAASDVACADLIASRRDRLEAALDHVFERTDEVRADADFARLDRDIVDWIEAEARHLPERAVDNLLQILNEAWVLDRYFPGHGLPDDFWDDAYGRVLYRSRGVHLVLNRGLLTSEISRLVFVHEVSHLLADRLDAPDLVGVSRLARASKSRRLGVYRGEIHAYRQEYRYLARNYAPHELLRFADAGEHYLRFRKRLSELPFARFEDEKLEIDFEKVRGDDDWTLLREYLKAEGDTALLVGVVDAFRMSEVGFVKKRVRPYEDDQRILTSARLARTRRRWGLGGVVAGVAGPVALKWLFGI